MRISTTTQPLLLGYRGATAADDAAAPLAPPGPVVPVMSIVPGLFSWLLFASAAMPRELPVLERLAEMFGTSATNGVVLGAWGLAVVTSLAALVYYARRPQAWHTTLCLAVHLAGVLFSLLVAGGLVILLVA